MLDSERCPQCNYPKYMCHSDHPRIRVRVEEDTCEAMAAVERRREQDQKSSGKDTPGVSLRPIIYTTDGSDLAKYRDEYYRGAHERFKEIQESLQTPYEFDEG